MKEIRVARGETKRMAKLFGYTDQTIRNAIRGVVQGEDTERIRAEALRAGGAEVKRRKAVSK